MKRTLLWTGILTVALGTLAIMWQMKERHELKKHRTEMWDLCAEEKRLGLGREADITALCAWTLELK